MKVNTFISKALDIVNNYKTLYVMGCFGAPLNDKNKKRYTTNHPYNEKSARTKMIKSASSDTFGFDCVCLIKSILWGWCGDESKTYGGAKYKSNGVPDIGADTMIKSPHSYDISKDMSKIEKGEVVWLEGHIGVYIGDGNVVECTPSWKNGVQITKLSKRKWVKHAKLKYLEYDKEVEKPVEKPVNNVDKKEEKPVSTTKTHVVKSGETLSSIAKKYKTTYQKIYNANKKLIDNENRKRGVPIYKMWIYPGQKLVIK